MLKKVLFYLLVALTTTNLQAQICGTPGKDGPFTGDGIVNTYYGSFSGTPTVNVGATSLQLGQLNANGATTPFTAGDVALIIQIQGVNMNSEDNTKYGDGVAGGTANGYINPTTGAKAGNYEYALVSAVSGSQVTFAAPLKYPYKHNWNVVSSGNYTYEVVRIPQYSSVVLTGLITGAKWNGQSGGIVGMDVAGNIALNGFGFAADGIGFRGGLGRQQHENPGSSTMSYRNTGRQASDLLYIDAYKGEGIAGTPSSVFSNNVILSTSSLYPNGSKGAGAPGNAGGGGSADAAGGGGSAYGAGGRGGDVFNTNGGFTQTFNIPDFFHSANFGGFGGASVGSTFVLGGGGGGGCNHLEENSHGGAGGGIVLVTTGSVSGTGTVNANGENEFNNDPLSPSNKGGGGGGGIIVFRSSNTLNSVTMNAKGGNSSNTTAQGVQNAHAPGGGGGGGAVYQSGGAITNASGGLTGICNAAVNPSTAAALGATNGANGLESASIPTTVLNNLFGEQNCMPSIQLAKSTSTPAATTTLTPPANTTYSITVTNAGLGGAQAIKLYDFLPDNPNFTFSNSPATIVSFNPPTGGKAAVRTGTVLPGNASTDLEFGTFNMPAGSVITLTFPVVLSENTASGLVSNSASVKFADPTRTTPTQVVSPGEPYNNPLAGAATGNNFNGNTTTVEDVFVCNLKKFVVTGGGSTCNGTMPMVGLSGSTAGISYQLYRDNVAVGSPVAGTNVSISFGTQSTAGTYTVIASLPTTTCTQPMTGNILITNTCAPIANTDNSQTPQNTPVTFNLVGNDSDPDGSIVPSTVDLNPTLSGIQTTITVPTQGTFTTNPNGDVTFQPFPTFTGVATTPYTVQDNAGNVSNVANINVTVLPAQNPIAREDRDTTSKGVPVTITILNNDNDEDGSLNASTVDLNPNVAGVQTTRTVPEGVFTVNTNGIVTFTPNPTFVGITAVIRYSVKDNQGNTSNLADIVVVVLNTIPPIAGNDATTTPLNTPTTINILTNDSDADGNIVANTVDLDPATPGRQTLYTVPNKGTFAVNPLGVVVFNPFQNFTGPVTIPYTIADNDGNTAQATITVTIQSNPPVANPDNATTTPNTPVNINALSNDNDPDGVVNPGTLDLNLALPGIQTTISIPDTGTFTTNPVNGIVTFTPANGFVGQAITPYVVQDMDNNVSNITFITVNVNEPILPILQNDATTTPVNTPVTLDVIANDNDPDGQINVVTLDLDPDQPGIQTTYTVPGKGTFVINNNGEVEFTPVQNFTGLVQIPYIVKDDQGNSPIEPAIIKVTVGDANQAPTAVKDVRNTPKNTPITFNPLTNDTDPNGDALNPASIDLDPTQAGIQTTTTIAGQGTFVVNPTTGEITFTPFPEFTGTVSSIFYTVQDNSGAISNTAEIVITVNPGAGPVANEDNATTPLNTPITFPILTNDVPAGSPLNVGSVDLDPATPGQQTTHTTPQGTFTYNTTTNQVTFTPVNGFVGEATTPYTILDNSGNISNTTTIKVNVLPVPVIGVAKSAVLTSVPDGSYKIVYTVTVKNLGNVDLQNVEVTDNLVPVFPQPVTYTITQLPTTTGNLNANTAYNGNSNINLLAPNSSLAVGETQTITFELNIKTNGKFGEFANIAIGTATGTNGIGTTVDTSNTGTNPDPNNNGKPNDIGEAKPTIIKIQDIFLPQGFSPNGDGIDDTWIITGDNDGDTKVQIFNRWGNIVYSSDSYNDDWNGKATSGIKFGEQLPDGSYYYVVKIAGKEKEYVGYLTIKR